MDFKNLFRKDDKAVSPVIGVILMVAITVILAAAIGSSVFSHGVSKSAPQANLDVKSAGFNTSTNAKDAADIKIEHIGGNVINLDKENTKIMISVNGGKAVQADPCGVKTLGVGNIVTIPLLTNNAAGTGLEKIVDNSVATDSSDPIKTDDTVNIKLIDIQTSQIFLDRTVRM